MTPHEREVMQMALEALESSRVFVTSREKIKHPEGTEWHDERIEALRAALAQPEPEPKIINMENFVGSGKPVVPVCWMNANDIDKTDWKVWAHGKPTVSMPLFALPPKKEWVGLTDDEYESMAEQYVTNCYFDTLEYAKAIEAKLKEKNSG